MDEVNVRWAEETDDFLEIGECLYLTDPYIYPAAFGEDCSSAARAIAALMRCGNGLMQLGNMVVAASGGKVCGVLLYNDGGCSWDTEAAMEAVRGLIPSEENFRYTAESYFRHAADKPPENTIEVVACCVGPEFRGRGLGRALLQWLMHKRPGCVLELAVLADNEAAIALYRKCGFVIKEALKGFALTEASRPDCYIMVRYAQ